MAASDIYSLGCLLFGCSQVIDPSIRLGTHHFAYFTSAQPTMKPAPFGHPLLAPAPQRAARTHHEPELAEQEHAFHYRQTPGAALAVVRILQPVQP